MGNRYMVLGALVLLSLLFDPARAAAEKADKEVKPSEFLLFEEIPMVVTPARKLQPITKSPAAVCIVTQEDIKQSGSIHLWDALRQVPGMDVGSTSIGQPDVSLRGFGDTLTNKTLLMIDGRSMYSTIQGILFWELITVQPEEVERIEVVKGPVSSLYGANANLGLINVITKTPEQAQGTTFASTAGTRDTASHTIIHGGRHEDLSYKVSAGWQETNAFKSRGNDALDAARGNMALTYKIDDDSSLSFSGGASIADFYVLSSAAQAANNWYYGSLNGYLYYLQSDYQSGGLKARLYWVNEKEVYDTAKRHIVNEANTLDAETSYSFQAGEKHSLTAGVGSRLYSAQGDIFESSSRTHRQPLWNVFLQDEYAMLEKLTLVGSARVDHYPLTGYIPSGHLAAIYPHNEKHLFRTSVGYSFRAPTFSDYYMAYYTPIAGPLNQTSWGNKGLDPETYLTVEAGYQGKFFQHKLRPFADIFWTKIKDFIYYYPTGGGDLGLDQALENKGEAYSAGVELGAEYDLVKNLTLIGNYALNHMKYRNTSFRYFCPRHKVNLGVKLMGRDDKLSLKLLAHYVSGTTSDSGETDDYVMANLWIGYQVNRSLELSISGYNILHDKHIESTEGEEIGTRILGSVRVRF